jgi:hypothetical protein
VFNVKTVGRVTFTLEQAMRKRFDRDRPVERVNIPKAGWIIGIL